ncbi:unnamed protein product [Caenorhabditis sp. 36 PRJEB53466]|nr:unnamed protein product [Caenorhabditis sp. 36 PRJEB53466]
MSVQGSTGQNSPNPPNPPNPPPEPENPPENGQHAAAPPPNAQNNQLNAARLSDRLFHAMLVRIALKYSGKVSLKWRKVIEGVLLFTALLLLSSLLFIHFNFTRSPATCLNDMQSDWIKKGVVRIEVVKNLEILEEKEQFISQYISEKSHRVCHFNPADVFRFGPSVIPYPRESAEKTETVDEKNRPMTYYSSMLSFLRPHLFFDEHSDIFMDKYVGSYEELEYQDPLEVEAQIAFHTLMKDRKPSNYEYMYRVEYAMLYGLLRLPPDFRDEHGIPTTWIRIDAKSHCFGDHVSRVMMRLFVGYEDAVVAALRSQAINLSLVHPETHSMGYLHNLQTHDHFHFVANSLGKSSYFTAALLMVVFTFAISMLLRFSHHQIFVFIIDLLHMFELQQPLNPPVAPLVTVVLALVGMEAIMAEVFNDTSIAFYVILIVWVADQYDAICCHSTTSKKYWLRFFYIYQFFFYSYQYRFAGQYGGLALVTSALFILHSMIYFFHHYEMPLILYQDRVSQVLADLHSPQFANGMGTVEVQTITVAVHNRQVPGGETLDPQAAAAAAAEQPSGQAQSLRVHHNFQPTNGEPLSPSSVFDARGPNLVQPEVAAAAPEIQEEREPQNAEEIIAHRIVNDAMNELFNHE